MIRAGALLGLGAAAGIWGSRWARRRLRALSPAGVAGTVAGSLDHAREEIRGFLSDVRVAADQRELELLTTLGVPGRPESTQDRPRSGTIV